MATCKLTKGEKAELQKLIGAYDSARAELLDFLTRTARQHAHR